MTIETDETQQSGGPGANEVFCTSCGEIIKSDAEICPDCGVRQKESQPQQEVSSELADARKYQLQKVARKSNTTVGIVSFLIPFAGYIMVGKNGLAIINLLTLNYLLLGIIIVPLHTNKIINDAQNKLEMHGENW